MKGDSMDTIITFTLKDLLLSGIYAALIVMIIYIIKILMKLHSSMKNINAIVEDNRKEIDLILKEAPGISKNVNDISEELAHDIAQFRGTVDNIAETTESVTEVVKENQSVVDGLTSVFHTASIAKGAYDKFFSKESEEHFEPDTEEQ